MSQKLVIVGAGSVGCFLAYNMQEFETSYDIIGFLDDDPQKSGKRIAGYPVLGNIDYINQLSKNTFFAVGVADPQARKTLVDKIQAKGFSFPPFISRHTWISNEVAIGKGAIIYPGTTINYESSLSDFVIINMNCAIGHNTAIGSFCTLAPGVKTAGFTIMDECTEVGIGAATRQNIRIGKHCIVGGQSMVIKDVPDYSVVAGIPAKRLNKNSLT